MKIVLVCLGLFALALATPAPTKSEHHSYKVADKDWLKKEFEILRLFKHVHQHSYYKDYSQVLEGWNWEQHWDWFSKPEVAKHFWYHWHHEHLPRHHIFSVFHEEHLKEAISLFKVFYYAKNWEYFWKTAVWARQHVNEGIFVYAFSVALTHRPDTQHFVLPPIYEIYPHYFFNSEAIHEAQTWKQQWQGHYPEQTTGFKGYTVHANYSGWYLNLHPEQSIGYFTEDYGVNSFYYYYNLFYPFWMNSTEFHIENPHRGEQFYYVHQQLLARYYLERLSNDMGEIPYMDWEWPVETGFYPSLHYPNGMEFPSRPSGAQPWHHSDHFSYAFYNKNYTWAYTNIKDYERRIRDAIDRGFVWTEEGKQISLWSEHGFEVLGDLIESNPDSPNARFYGNLQVFARYFLGYSHHPLHKYHLAPSALEHFSTSLRDPAFYQMFKRIIAHFQKYKGFLKPYNYEYLHFPGVEVYKAEFDELHTFFDGDYSDLSNAVYVNEKEFQEDSVHVRAHKYRLNHQPFTYKLFVKSAKPVETMVRVFIGPKYDEYGRFINITYNRYNFVEFDRFHYKLTAGDNVISRNSYSHWYGHDQETFEEMFHHVSSAMEGKTEYHIYDHDYYYGFPSRFALPKGTEHGQEYQFYFIATPYHPDQKVQSHHEWYYPAAFDTKYVDAYPLGYPFDRPIYDEYKFYVPNSYFHTVKIFHDHHEHHYPQTYQMRH